MIAAIILAAGQSCRMGRNKMLLPFGVTTVIKTVVDEVAACESVRDIVVVTGHEHEQIEATLSESPARCVLNPKYAQAEMLASLQVGLRAMQAGTRAALIALGDQPCLQRAIVQRVIDAYAPDALVIPSLSNEARASDFDRSPVMARSVVIAADCDAARFHSRQRGEDSLCGSGRQ